MSTIRFISETKFQLNNKRNLKKMLTALALEENKTIGNLNYIFVDDAQILKINQQYLEHDYYTDIISFDYTEGDIISGDIYVSVDTVLSNADKFKQPFGKEIHRIIFHGILHLCGYKDKKPADKKLMTQKEDYYLTKYFNTLSVPRETE